MDRRCKHTFRPGCEDLEGRQLLSGPGDVAIVRPPGTDGSVAVNSQTLRAELLPQTSSVPGFLYEAAVVTTKPNSPLRTVALANGTVTSLNQGDRILSLDGIAVNKDGSNLEQHIGQVTMQFARSGSNAVLTGTIIIPI